MSTETTSLLSSSAATNSATSSSPPKHPSLDTFEVASLDSPSSYAAPPVLESLPRHLTLFDLVTIGVGGTVGSGIFVLCGLIAHDYAGPSTFLSWAIAGLAACLSGFCCAELAGKIPEAGSAYSYASVTLGEYPAFLAACCLTLNYVGSASAVARSWGDKVSVWSEAELGSEHWFSRLCDPWPGSTWNPMAFLVAMGSVTLLLKGVEESKWATNVFTYLKVGLVTFMVVLGAYLGYPDFKANMSPLVPPEFGINGIFRGATSCFFGYIGFDEACCLGGEALDPQRTLPRAVIWTISIVTLLYMAAAVVLTGMQPYVDISGESGFPDAFRAHGVGWAAQISAAGEIITLPIVVLISILAQPRLQWAVARDGLIPQVFAEVDERGNLWKGTLYSGSLMIAVATFVPFGYLDDTISIGILLAFCITNWSVISLRYQTAEDGKHSVRLDWLLLAFNILSMISGLLSRHAGAGELGRMTFRATSAILAIVAGLILGLPQSTGKDIDVEDYYHAPLVPFLPMLGIYVNWYLIAQLEITGILILLAYLLVATLFYFVYGLKHSRGKRKRRGWKAYQEARGGAKA